MLAEAVLSLFNAIMRTLPILELPTGFSTSLTYFSDIIGYANVFLPVARLLPVLAMIVLIRRFNIVMAIINWIIRLIPFIG